MLTAKRKQAILVAVSGVLVYLIAAIASFGFALFLGYASTTETFGYQWLPLLALCEPWPRVFAALLPSLTLITTLGLGTLLNSLILFAAGFSAERARQAIAVRYVQRAVR